MAQVTVDMCNHIMGAAVEGERFPLTVDEMMQLAYLARQNLERDNGPVVTRFVGGLRVNNQ